MDILARGLGIFLDIYITVVIVNVILSWVMFGTQSSIVRIIYAKTGQFVDPVLQPIRRLLYPMSRNIGIDFSPIVLLVLLHILNRILTKRL